MIRIFLCFSILIYVESLPLKLKKCKQDDHQEPLKQTKALSTRNTYENLIVDVIFNIFHDNEDGKVPKQALKNQISVLNNAFSGKYSKKSMIDSNIRFRIKEYNYINSFIYYNNCDRYDTKIPKLYSKDNDITLNIAVCNSLYYLGWAYMPWYFNEKNKLNTIFIHTQSLPNGIYEEYNMGMTAVHEIGHYFGLLHTFSVMSRCEEGDYISDTPIEKYPSFSCEERDSCPNHPGKDPINNFMDYSPDKCIFEFTTLQVKRMWNMIDRYKPKLKMISQYNYLKTQYIVSYYKKGKGFCVDKYNKKFDTIKLNNNGVYLEHDECKRFISKYNSFAYTFINKNKAEQKKLKYNCFLHKLDIEQIVNIKNSPNYDKNRYEDGNCYSIKLLPKTTTVKSTIN